MYFFMYHLRSRLSAPKCLTTVDVGFILDSSGSLRKNYAKEKDFLKAVAAKIGFNSIGPRVGVVTFSYFSELNIKLSDHSDISSFKQAVDNIPLMGLTTRIDKALCLAQEELFSFSNGGRADVPKILILLTDGSQTGASQPSDITEELQADGINILAVGIGQGVDKTELREIAGNLQSVYISDSFDKIIGPDFISVIANKICEASNGFACESSEVFS